MTQTTTAINACDAAIWLDNAAGTPTDVSGSSNSVTLNLANTTAAYRNFQTTWPKRLECGKDGSVDLIVTYSTGSDEGLDILRDWFFATPPGNRTLKFYLPDKNAGSDVYSGEFKIETLVIPATAGEAAPVTVTAHLVPDGAISYTAAST